MKNILLYEQYSEFSYLILDHYYKLIDIYDDVPDEHELLWSFINIQEYNNDDFLCVNVNVMDLYNSIKDTIEYITSDQQDIINFYITNPNEIKNQPIIISDDIVVDGNHRIMALYELGIKSINVIDLFQ